MSLGAGHVWQVRRLSKRDFRGERSPIRPPPKHLSPSQVLAGIGELARRQAGFVYRGGGFNAYSHGVVCGAWDETPRQDDRLRWP
jgi:hypothetical protein